MKDIVISQSVQQLAHQVQESELLEDQMNRHELVGLAQHSETTPQIEKSALANQLFGRLQLAGAMTKMLNITTLLDLKRVKEEKLYLYFKGVAVTSPTGEVVIITTWKTFCVALGLSREHIDEQLRNINAFGAEVYETMTHAGIGLVAMRPIRTLPENEFKAVVSEIEAHIGNKDAIIDLIEDINVKHFKEKEQLVKANETLQQKLEDNQAKSAATERYLQTKEQKINELEKVVNKCLTPDEARKHQLDQEQQLKKELGYIEAECALAIDKLDLAIGKIFDYDKRSEELDQMPNKLYEYLLKHLVNVADQYQLRFDAQQILSPILNNLSPIPSQESQG